MEIKDGRIDGVERVDEPADATAREDLNRKLRAIAQTELFANLNLKQQRIPAFASQWYKVEAGQTIFDTGDAADATYLCVKGMAGLYWPIEGEDSRPGAISVTRRLSSPSIGQ